METIDFDGDDSDNSEIMARVLRNEVLLRCRRCKGPIRIDRLRGDPEGPIAMIRCETDERHCLVRYQHRLGGRRSS